MIQPQQDGRVFAFRQADGRVEWIAPMLHSPQNPGNDQRYAVVSGDIVVVTSLALGGSVIGYDAATGAERWRQTGFSGTIIPPVADGTAAFIDHGWVFASYETATGALRWASPATLTGPETMFKGAPITTAERIFVAGRDGSYALRR